MFNIQPKMVFPSTKMDSINKLITEGNLTKLINNLIDTDSYIISPSNAILSNTVQKPEGTMVDITTSKDKELEFILKGYYFNLGTINNVAEHTAVQVGAENLSSYKLVARIFVDTSVANYPELFGEQDMDKSETISVEQGIVSGETQISILYRDKSITKIEVSDGTNIVEAQYNPADYTIVVQDTDTTYTSYTIYYKDYSTIINLYAVSLDTNVSAITNDIQGVTDFEAYDLELLYCYNGDLYIPLKSFGKFNTMSIMSIDGGLI